MGETARLLPGPANFRVEEIPAYDLCGSGEHLYAYVETEGLTSEQVAQILLRASGLRRDAIGMAGRKDRHAVARQWFSLHFGAEESLQDLAEPGLKILTLTRHRNKLKPGHLKGNRFVLGLADLADAEVLRTNLACLTHEGFANRFGDQRFGLNGANLQVARALGQKDLATAIRFLVDASGAWQITDPLPDRWMPPPEGHVLAALRRNPQNHRAAVQAGGPHLLKLLANAAQSAVFNAVLAARQTAGLLRRFRPGDVGQVANGAFFRAKPEEIADLDRRAEAGCLEVSTTGPLPGCEGYHPSLPVMEEEKAWSASTGFDWTWFGSRCPLECPGDRRALVARFLEPPTLEVADAGRATLTFALGKGCFATEVLRCLAITVPEDRRAE